MAKMTIRLRTDAATGKKDIVVSLEADEDALPLEHEQQHRQLVERLLGMGLVQAAELGKVVIEREEKKGEAGSLGESLPEERRAEAQGN